MTTSLPTVWSLSGSALGLYVLAAVILLGVLAANLNVAEALAGYFQERRAGATAAVGVLAFASNLIGAATLSLLSKALREPVRLSMAALPLLLVAERYVRRWNADRGNRPSYLAGLTGSIAGVLAAMRLLLRGGAASEGLTEAVVPGDVATVPLSQVLDNPDRWVVSLPLVVLYVAALAIFFAVHAFVKLAARTLEERGRDDRLRQAALTLLTALAMNFVGVGALCLSAQALGVEPRLAMVGLALLLILESYVTMLRKEAGHRGALWAGLVGSMGGMASATYLFMRDAPLH